MAFSGPIPPPALLQQYNQIIPNGADRIMQMAERQSAHRESLELMVVTGNVKAQTRGTLYAFIICMVVILGGLWLLYTGKSIVGLVTILGSLATLAGVFIVGRSKQAQERNKKSRALARKKK